MHPTAVQQHQTSILFLSQTLRLLSSSLSLSSPIHSLAFLTANLGSVAVDQDVFALEISEDDALRMEIRHSSRNVRSDVDSPFPRQQPRGVLLRFIVVVMVMLFSKKKTENDRSA